jgi:hypothetical protein
MALSKWSVRLSLEEREAGPISSVMVYALRSDVHGMTIGRGAIDEADEPGAFTVEIDGADPDDARVRAQHMLGELQRRANITVRQAPVVWVVRLSDDRPSSLRFLAEAEGMIDDEHNEMAVVAAQIHLEVQVRVLVEAAIEASSEGALVVVLQERRVWSPHDRFVQAILVALFDVTVKNYPGWGDYMAHVSRRGAVVHRGQAIDADSARASLEAVSGFWLWLNAEATAKA